MKKNNDKTFLSEMTITLRCVICHKEKTYHQYIISSPKKELEKIIKTTKQDKWISNTKAAYTNYKCKKCKDIKYPGINQTIKEEQERMEKKNRKLNLEFIETHRKENEMTTEEIEEQARGEN